MIKSIMFFVGVLACGAALGAGQTATEAYVTNRVAALSNATWTAIASGDLAGTNYTDAVSAGKVGTNDARVVNALTNTPTLQQVVTAGGTVSNSIVTIDAANARTNTYGGYLGIGPNRWQANGGDASGEASWANYYGTASGVGSWANVYGVAKGPGSWANGGTASGNGAWANGGTASSVYSWAMGTAAVASNANSFAWNDQVSHGVGSFNIGAPSLLWLNGISLQTLLDGKLSTDGLTAPIIAAAGGVTTNVLTDALNSPYQAYTSVGSVIAGTCTVTFASGSLVRLTATDSPTVLTFDNSNFPTSGVSRVAVELWAGTNSITFPTATITNSVAPTISTNDWTSLIFRRSGNKAVWTGGQVK